MSSVSIGFSAVRSLDHSCFAPLYSLSSSPSKSYFWPEAVGGVFRRWKDGGSGRLLVLASAAVEESDPGMDYAETNWKDQFQKDFERRFDLPHLTDLFSDLTPIPSTFRLKKRSPSSDDYVNGYLYREQYNGYINNDDRVLLKVIHRAGPRKEIFFRPGDVNAAIVTCGGLCPGLNDVIRQIVITLEMYGVKKIVGIPHGYRGFSAEEPEIPLSRKAVQTIHLSGGSILGVSRGGPDIEEIVNSIQARGINMLFVLGGDGTHAGANAMHKECNKRRIKVAVVGVPKTIDNDILYMDRTFGFDTAVEEAQRAINSAYIEAHSAYHGIGIVKLMGRSSGFIAMHASLASGQVDVCLIPEEPFTLHGPNGVLRHLRYLVQTKGSAVVCVAEGAGQDLLEKATGTDASGNKILSDIGIHVVQETRKYFKEIGVPADVKYIDPTYMIRAVRANAADGILCTVLGQNAVHGAFAGFSGITVGVVNTHYAYFPIPEVISHPRLVDTNSRMWHRCLTSTGQPDFI
ncbi:hypothetical protein KFK09_022180 [Dendrobium nobile]|uniref:ATP-dependent 6-phosphofructokinase n=1 Tax=Dendrobium nobile TaxID=94219 RepID=A0A8T3AI60_DENNO|nr:hypothetical protein KFK09_022180 [Dendrobium nobile]